MDEIIKALGSAVRGIRVRTTGTQEAWSERTGMAQSYISAVERGASGWESVRTILDAIQRAGGDPWDMIREAAMASVQSERAEVNVLWESAKPDVRQAILILLRDQAHQRSAREAG